MQQHPPTHTPHARCRCHIEEAGRGLRTLRGKLSDQLHCRMPKWVALLRGWGPATAAPAAAFAGEGCRCLCGSRTHLGQDRLCRWVHHQSGRAISSARATTATAALERVPRILLVVSTRASELPQQLVAALHPGAHGRQHRGRGGRLRPERDGPHRRPLLQPRAAGRRAERNPHAPRLAHQRPQRRRRRPTVISPGQQRQTLCRCQQHLQLRAVACTRACVCVCVCALAEGRGLNCGVVGWPPMWWLAECEGGACVRDAGPRTHRRPCARA